MPEDPRKTIYEVGSFKVTQEEFLLDGYIRVSVWRVDPSEWWLASWMGMLRPRKWPWPCAELALLFRALDESGSDLIPEFRCRVYEDALDRAIKYAEELAATDDARFLSERVERKLAEVQLRQNVVKEIEAGLAPRQITDNSRESD